MTVQHGVHEGLLGREVLQDRGTLDPSSSADLRERGALDAVLGEQHRRRLDDRRATRLALRDAGLRPGG